MCFSIIESLRSMADLVRDTVFGHFVRLIPGNKLLKYPDESDPSLGRRAIEEEASDGMEKTSNVEEVKSVHLVTWYGEDDPEVVYLICLTTSLRDANKRLRILKTGQVIESF